MSMIHVITSEIQKTVDRNKKYKEGLHYENEGCENIVKAEESEEYELKYSLISYFGHFRLSDYSRIKLCHC